MSLYLSQKLPEQAKPAYQPMTLYKVYCAKCDSAV